MPSNQIQFECPKCLAIVRATTDQAGQRISCSDCHASLKVPDMVIGERALGDLFDSDSSIQYPDSTETPETATKNTGKEKFAKSTEELFADLDVDSLKFEDDEPQKPLKTSSQDDDVTDLQDRHRGDSSPQPVDEQSAHSGQDDASIIIVNDDEALPKAAPIDHGDPFEYDETAAIKIEGLIEDITTEEVFGVKCPVCDTRIHVNVDQVGQQVGCPICYTKVRVPEPPRKPETKPAWQAPAQAPADDELRLEQPIERPKVDPIEEGYGLAPVEEDLLSPRTQSNELSLQRGREVNGVDELVVLPDEDPASVAARPRGAKQAESLQAESLRQPTADSNADETPTRSFDVSTDHEITTFAILKDWFKRIGTNLELIMRTALAVTFLALAYMMFDAVSAVIVDPDTNFGEKFVGAAMPVIGGLLCFAIAAITLSITFAMVLRDSAAGDTKMDQWPGFGLSEWFGSFAFVGFSLWLASLPGIVIGNIGWAMTDSVDVMIIIATISMFLVAPFLLISALYNDSILNVFAPEILKSLSRDSAGWIATYKFVGIAFGIFILGTLILYLPTFPFSFVGAIIHAIAFVALALVIGLQAGRVIGDIQQNA